MKLKASIQKIRKKRKKKAVSTGGEDNILILSASTASSKAIRSSRALGLTIKIIKGDRIISVNADKTENVGRVIMKSQVDLSKLKKGMYLERK